MNTQSAQSKAFKDYIDAHAIKQCDLAKLLGVTPATISNIISGRFGISKEIATRLHELYGMNTIFLMTGKGQLFPDSGRKMENITNSTITQGDNSPINIVADNSALKAENERLRAEVEWLRSMLEKREK